MFGFFDDDQTWDDLHASFVESSDLTIKGESGSDKRGVPFAERLLTVMELTLHADVALYRECPTAFLRWTCGQVFCEPAAALPSTIADKGARLDRL